jgi:hypothetical protein
VDENTNLQATSAAAWSAPRREGMLIELPSGNVARLRRALDLVFLLKTGQIPNPLANVVNNMIRKQSAEFPMKDMDEKALQQMLELVEQTCVQCFLEPKVAIPPRVEIKHEDGTVNKIADPAWDPPEDTISIDDLDMKDKFFVFGFVQGGSADLKTFREQSTPSVDTVQDGEGVQPEAVEPAGTG